MFAATAAMPVLIDGDVVLACRYPVAKARSKKVITIEGIGSMENPHPLSSHSPKPEHSVRVLHARHDNPLKSPS
jgi:aerobic-type carbon monoxide dehydrogenase small subunit (CoxS/CutS family)